MPRWSPALPTSMSMRAKLMVGVTAVVALALAALTMVSISKSGATQRGAVQREAANLSRAQAADLAQEVGRGLTIARGEAAVAAGYRGTDRRVVIDVLRETLRQEPSLFGTWIVFAPDGAPGVDADNRRGPGADEAGRFAPYWTRDGDTLSFAGSSDVSAEYDEDYYRASAESRRPETIEPYLDTSVNVVMTSFTAPVMRDGRVLGVAGVDVSLADLNALVAKSRVLESGYAMVVSRGGLVLAAPDPKLAGTKTLVGLPGVDRAAMTAVLEAGRTGKPVRVEGPDPLRGEDALMFASPVPGSGWTYLLVAPTHEVLAPTARLRTLLLALGAAGVVLIALGVFALVTRVTRPLRGLRTAAQRIATGDTDAPIPPAGRDEVGEVAEAFTGLAGYLREHALTARRVADGDLTVDPEARSDHDALGTALVDMVRRLRALVGEVAEGAGSVARSASRVSEQTQASRAAMSAIGVSVERMADGAERQRALVDETGVAVEGTGRTAANADRSAEEGMALADQTREAMLQIAAASGQATAAIGSLEQRSGQIAGIVGEVEVIADQTRLLALNASIEAARAGDAGRGFAVVAQEVQELAARAQTAAGTIGHLVGGTRADVDRAVAIVQLGAENSEEATGVVERSREAFNRIRGDVASVQEQVRTLEDVSGTVAQVTADARAQTAAASDAAMRASEATSIIDSSVDELVVEASRLTESIARFRLPD